MTHDPRAACEFAVRFQPVGGGKFVPIEQFVGVLDNLREGFAALRRSLAPAIAERVQRPAAEVRMQLAMSAGPTEPGSLVVPIAMSCAAGQLDIASTTVANLYWRMTASVLSRAARGLAAAGVTAACAESFARAAVPELQVQLVDRKLSGQPWRTAVKLSVLQRGLRDYANKRSEATRAREQLVGRIVLLDWDRPSFTLDAPRGRVAVRMATALRDRVQCLWGKEVVVDVKTEVTADGEFRDPVALEVAEAAKIDDLVRDFDESFGRFKDTFGTPEAQEYLRELRGGRS